MSLATPEKVRKLQRALYVKAKQDPTWRFHFLYDKVWREDILAMLMRAAVRTAGPRAWTEKPSRASRHTEWIAGSVQCGSRFEQNATDRNRSNAC